MRKTKEMQEMKRILSLVLSLLMLVSLCTGMAIAEEERRRGKAKLTWKLGGTKVVECNMIEQDETPVEFDGESFEFTYRPFEVKTFRIF